MDQQTGKTTREETRPEDQVSTATTTTTATTESDAAVVEATEGVRALRVGGAESPTASSEAAGAGVASGVGETDQATGGQEAPAEVADAVDGQGETSSSDAGGAALCAQGQSDDRAVLQVLFET